MQRDGASIETEQQGWGAALGGGDGHIGRAAGKQGALQHQQQSQRTCPVSTSSTGSISSSWEIWRAGHGGSGSRHASGKATCAQHTSVGQGATGSSLHMLWHNTTRSPTGSMNSSGGSGGSTGAGGPLGRPPARKPEVRRCTRPRLGGAQGLRRQSRHLAASMPGYTAAFAAQTVC